MKKTIILSISVLLICVLFYFLYKPVYTSKIVEKAAKFSFFIVESVIDYPTINTHAEIDSIFNTFEKRSFGELPPYYLQISKSSHKKYKHRLAKKDYYVITRADLIKPVAGNVRVRHLLPVKDVFFKNSILKNDTLFWLMDKRVVHKLLALQIELAKQGYDPNGFEVICGHRYPGYNEQAGGKPHSKHILGEAIDIEVADVDKNGKYEKSKDHKIIYDILDKKIIGNKGGLGCYPNSRTLHFDVRGKIARWNRM